MCILLVAVLADDVLSAFPIDTPDCVRFFPLFQPNLCLLYEEVEW